MAEGFCLHGQCGFQFAATESLFKNGKANEIGLL